MRAPIVVAVVVVLAFPAFAQGRREKREERREERAEKREELQDKRDERREEPRDPGVNKKQRRQGSRIIGGVRSGQLSPQEVEALTSREKALRELEAKAKADGSLSVAERRVLTNELQALSRQIRSEKNDLDHRAPLSVRSNITDKALAQKARRVGEVRRTLNGVTLSAGERAALETEHSALLDALYEEGGVDVDAPPVGRGW
ncbi:MAG: hypothetical protein Q8O67_12665 [Deltaproteobacteria bacterium]|nr:hypothetical protein [Deltaproteobacteria bacterium]